jgi:uncharacterized protein (TIGR00369 family)
VPPSRSWRSIHDAIQSGSLPGPSAIGVEMRLEHRHCERGRWKGEIVFERGAANSSGIIHGGFLCSILDIAMGFASLSVIEASESQRTLELKVSFLAGIPPDRVLVEGEVLRRGKRTVYCEGSVHSSTGELVARASGHFAIRRAD